MKYTDYEKAFSQARLSKYSYACGADNMKALTLYRHNIRLCQKFYGILNLFEIVFRNAINEHYKCYLSDTDWIRTQLNPGGILEQSPALPLVKKELYKLQTNGIYTHDRLVSSVTLGFWTYLFTKIPFNRGGKTLLQVFPNKQKGLGQKAIYNELMQIKKFRNRIAHHEPICFDVNNKKDVVFAQSNYQLILKYISFLGYNKDELLYGFDVSPDTIINKIISL